MELVIQKILSVIGWQRLLKMCWNAIQDDLKKAAAKTETQFDDNVVVIMDEIISVVVGDEKAA